ncbi:MAG: ABC transporter permease, partial [Bacteroidales bacterium]|nr:ABC transporter permease [Bacteroidales bacterium]
MFLKPAYQRKESGRKRGIPRRNSVDTLVTTAVMALGITCLVGVETSVDALSALISDALGATSENVLTISPRSDRHPELFTPERCRPVFRQFGSRFPTAASTMVALPDGVQHNGRSLSPLCTVTACEGDYLQCNAIRVTEGRCFSDIESRSGAGVCLVGSKTADEIGPDAIGETVTAGGFTFTVTGITENRISFLGAVADYGIIIPLRSAETRFPGLCAPCIVAICSDDGGEAALGGEVRQFLAGSQNIPVSTVEECYEMTSSNVLNGEINNIRSSLSLAALFISLLTLVGSATSLTNIMLISVRERTREIGLLKAIGASKRKILLKFLGEGGRIAEMGCLAGTVCGLLIGNILPVWLGTNVQIPWKWIIISQGICIVISLVSSLRPAVRASNMNAVT